jgi:type IV secretory pathway TrbD component
MDTNRGTPVIYFKSLNRSFTVLGVDRQFFFLCVGLCLPIAFSGRFMPVMDSVAVLFFVLLYGVGLVITRADAHMLVLYRRHIHYQKSYATHPGLHAKTPLLKPSVPFYEGKRGLL